jgi:hypothetical protein
MIVRAWTQGEGFSLVIDWPNRKFALIPNHVGEGVNISTSYNELLDLQNLISERLADFKKLQQKELLSNPHEGDKKP